MTNLQSYRLVYRPFEETDSTGLYQLDSDPLVHRYIGNHPIHTVAEARAVIDLLQKQYAKNGIGRYATFEKKSGEFIGWTGVKFRDDEEAGLINFYDIGYRLIPAHWNKGYATEATKFWLHYTFQQFKPAEIFAAVNIENTASRRVLEKCGLTYYDSFSWHDIPCDRFRIKLEELRDVSYEL